MTLRVFCDFLQQRPSFVLAFWLAVDKIQNLQAVQKW